MEYDKKNPATWTEAQKRTRSAEHMSKIRAMCSGKDRTLEAQLANAEMRASELRLRASRKQARLAGAKARAVKLEANPVPAPPETRNGATLTGRVQSLEDRLNRLERELGMRVE